MNPRSLGRLLAALLVAAGLATALPTPAAATDGPGVADGPAAAGGTVAVSTKPLSQPYGGSTTLIGTFAAADGTPVKGATFVAEARKGSGWAVVSEPGKTDASGEVRVTLRPRMSTVARLRQVDGDLVSDTIRIDVHAALFAKASPKAVRVGQPVRLSGSLDPVPPGATLRVDQRVGKRWQKVARVRVARNGSWATTVVPRRAGWARYRVVRASQYGVKGATARVRPVDVYRLHRYTVATRGQLTASIAEFRATVAATLADPRGWRRAHHRFVEVPRGGAMTVVLAQARTLPSFAGGCSAAYSCRSGRYVVINAMRWGHSSPHFTGDRSAYRQMVVNHETGHWLGLGHARCSRPGALAPVMQQQSKGMHGCRPNAWPLPGEIRAVA